MNKTGKIVVFASGIAVGAIASVLAFMSINSSSEKVTEKKESVTESNVNNSENKKSELTAEVNETSNHETITLKTIPIVVADGESDYYPNIDNNSKLYDSLSEANGNLNFEMTGDHEVVKKEKLLKVGKLKVVKKIQAKQKQAADTLLNTIHVKPDNYPDQLEIEFWQTPLNSKGYRSGKNKIAVYGLDTETLLEIYQLNEGLFLKNDKSVYKIEKSSEFKSFKTVTEKEILDQLH